MNQKSLTKGGTTELHYVYKQGTEKQNTTTRLWKFETTRNDLS